jgi:hypothetical protein
MFLFRVNTCLQEKLIKYKKDILKKHQTKGKSERKRYNMKMNTNM